MAVILHIDSAIDTASICLAEDGGILALAANTVQRDHASWMHQAIREMMQEKKLGFESLDAIAVTIGPGSYTGLRVSLAAAKGLCFALNIPLLTLNTLEVMTRAALKIESEGYCPLIDARRMEVFTAIYDPSLHLILAPASMILEANSFDHHLEERKILFFGNGSRKLAGILQHPNATFADISFSAADMVQQSLQLYGHKSFSDLAYTEPLYLKDFYSPSHIN